MTRSVSCANLHVSACVCMCKRSWKGAMRLPWPLLVNLLPLSELKMNFLWKGSSREGRLTSLFPKPLTPFLSWHATLLYKVSQYRDRFHVPFHCCEFSCCVLSNPVMAPGSLHWVVSLFCRNGILQDTGSQSFSQCRKAWFFQYLSYSWFSGSAQQFLGFSWELVAAFFRQRIY